MLGSVFIYLYFRSLVVVLQATVYNLEHPPCIYIEEQDGAGCGYGIEGVGVPKVLISYGIRRRGLHGRIVREVTLLRNQTKKELAVVPSQHPTQ